MATPTDSPLTGEIWHLSIDDLFSSLPLKPRLGGPGPFVINLSASTAPISLPKGAAVGSNRGHVYQIRRIEDHRLRYRLRLGPFAGEDEADAVLAKVRDFYPGALTATADTDDQRALAQIEAKAEWAKPAAPAHGVAPAAVPARAAMAVAPESTLTMTAPGIAPAANRPDGAMRPGATMLAVQAGSPATPIPGISPVVEAPKLTSPSRVREVESTLTVRALTTAELDDEETLRSFVIELAQSVEPFDPEAVPHLDIFSAYRLYSVASIDQGKIIHSLRLGFFGEEIAAVAVSNYLAAFYDKPVIRRVSRAERNRFADQRLEARKDVGATGKHASIEITNERYIREKRPMQGQE